MREQLQARKDSPQPVLAQDWLHIKLQLQV